MSDIENKKLADRIQKLEADLKTKEQDLKVYRDETTKLNFQIQGLIKKMELEVELARKMHLLLVPTEIPNISGFEFSTKFEASLISGGDYYDIFEMQDKFNFGVLISSASGHSLSALFLSILLSMGVKNESKKTVSAEPLMEFIIKEILGSIETDKNIHAADFANLFYAVIDRRRFQFNYAHLGDMPIFYLPYGEKAPRVLEPTGPVLRAGYSEPVKSKNIGLNPRDKVILASPGLVSNTNGSGESFGLDRCIRTIMQHYTKSTHDLRHALFYELQKFTNKDWERDVTVVVIEVQDRVIKLTR